MIQRINRHFLLHHTGCVRFLKSFLLVFSWKVESRAGTDESINLSITIVINLMIFFPVHLLFIFGIEKLPIQNNHNYVRTTVLSIYLLHFGIFNSSCLQV